MSMNGKITERRTYKRFQVKNGGYAVINGGPVIMAPIIDISSNGLAVRYIDKKKLLRKSSGIDIFSSSANFYLTSIQIDIVSECKISSKFTFNSKKVWRRHMQFSGLTSRQNHRLDFFLENYTSMIKRFNKDRRQFNGATYSGLERRKGIERREKLLQI